MSNAGAVRRAAVPVSSARAEASRRNGAKSRGPRTPEGKARSAQNALKHGLRAQKYLVLPEEDAAEFAGLQAALNEELAPVGALQTVLARRVAVAAWRLARADRIEVDLFAEHHMPHGGTGLALIRDGNGTRSFETLLRYRGAAMAEFWRALRTLKALQAEQAAMVAVAATPARAQPGRPAAEIAERTDRRPGYVLPEPPAPRMLHESPAPWMPSEPDRRPAGPAPTRADISEPNEPEAHAQPQSRGTFGRDARFAPAVAAVESFPDADRRASAQAGSGSAWSSEPQT